MTNLTHRLTAAPGRFLGVGRSQWQWYLLAGLAALCIVALPTSPIRTALVTVVLLSGATAVAVGIRRNRPTAAPGWWLIAAAFAAAALGHVLWNVGYLVMGAKLFPSVVDAVYLAQYPLLALGLVVLTGRLPDRPLHESLLDAAVLVVGLGGVTWTTALHPILETQRLSGGARGVALTYMVFDLLVLAGLARLVLAGGLRRPATALLTFSVIALLVADVAYFRTVATAGTIVAGHFSSVAWLAAAVCCGAAALHPSINDVARPAPDCFRGRMAAFVLLALTGPVLTLSGALATQQVGGRYNLPDALVATCLGAAMAVLLVVRLGLTAGLARQRARALAQQASELEKALAEQENLQRLLSYHALHDPLTGLANRTLLTERIERALARRDAGAYLIMLDLDRFKDINDTHGHVVGDELLVAVAHRLLGRLAGTDTLARLGADQFAVLLENAGEVRAATVAAGAVDAVRAPYKLAGPTVRLSASAGVAALQPPLTASDALRDADAAVQEAKRVGRNRVVTFEPELRSARLDHTRLALGLREALAGREFTLVYQPVVDLNTGQIKVVESLLRWTRATGEVVPPAQFIPVAEDTGLIMAIGAWVLGEACRRARGWFSAAGVAVSVNVSGHQLRDARFPALVAETLQRSGLPGQGLIIEITETALIAETGAEASAVRDRLERIREMGIRVAIDDFGTGYSSLSYLRHLPAEILKIDKAFIQGDGGATRSPRDRAFLRAILQLAGTVQLEAIAEGVETEEQARLLHMLGYPLAQGYMFHQPQTPEEIDQLFASGHASGIALTDRLSA